MNDILLSLKSLIFVIIIFCLNFRNFCTFLDITGSSMKIVALSTKKSHQSLTQDKKEHKQLSTAAKTLQIQ